MSLKRSILAGAVATAAVLAASQASAVTIKNGGFEDIVDDWTANPALVQTPGQFSHHDGNGAVDKVFKPVSGFMLGVIQAGQGGEEITIVQTFNTIGGLFTGWAAFAGEDEADYNDYAFVRLIHSGGTIELFKSDIATVGAYGYTPWTQFSAVLDAGTYTLEAGVANFDDEFNPSFLLVDAFHFNEVPEPSTWALMISGFGLAGAALRRRRIAAA